MTFAKREDGPQLGSIPLVIDELVHLPAVTHSELVPVGVAYAYRDRTGRLSTCLEDTR